MCYVCVLPPYLWLYIFLKLMYVTCRLGSYAGSPKAYKALPIYTYKKNICIRD